MDIKDQRTVPLTILIILVLLTVSLSPFTPLIKAQEKADLFLQDPFLNGVFRPDFQPDPEEKGEGETTPGNVQLLKQIIHGEAEGESFTGKVAVGAVVLNRVRSPLFPNTIPEVIYEEGQFEPVRDKRLYLEADSQAKEAAWQALQGVDPSGGALYFYNRKRVQERGRDDLIQWFDENTRVTAQIGQHTFTR